MRLHSSSAADRRLYSETGFSRVPRTLSIGANVYSQLTMRIVTGGSGSKSGAGVGVAVVVEVLVLICIGVSGTVHVAVVGTTVVVLVLLITPSTIARTVEMWILKVPKLAAVVITVDPALAEVLVTAPVSQGTSTVVLTSTAPSSPGRAEVVMTMVFFGGVSLSIEGVSFVGTTLTDGNTSIHNDI